MGLTVSLTDTKLRNRLVTGFLSKEDLVAALVCSCFLPIFSGSKLPYFRGERYLDGGLTNQLPTLDQNTVKISPFSGKDKQISPDISKQGLVFPSVRQGRVFPSVRMAGESV